MDSPVSMTGWVITFLGSSVIGSVIGTYVGARLSRKADVAARRLQFIERQLQEFYGPMAALRREIRTKSLLRTEVSSAANECWQKGLEGLSREGVQRVLDEDSPKYRAIIDYHNEQLREELLPSYRKMLDLFRDRLWLAEDSTTQHYAALVRFVEIWNRWLAKTLPGDVVERLGHSEEELTALYQDVDGMLVKLRERVKKGKP